MATVLEPSAAPVSHDIDRQVLRSLMQPSLWQWSVRVAGDWAIMIGPLVLAGYTRHWAAYALAVIMCGIGQHRIALMAHEGSHRQVTRNKRLNDLLTGIFCLWPFANPVDGYRRFHFNHHRYLNTEGDPELHHKQKSSPAWDLPADWHRALKYFLQDVCLLHVKELFQLTQNARPATSFMDSFAPSIWWAVAFTLLAVSGQWWILAVWFAGTALVFWPIFRLRIWTEHIGTHDVHRLHYPWWALRAILVPHNTWYHYEHHHFPQVPCWNLPKVRALIGPVPEIHPVGAVLASYRTSPEIKSGAPTRELRERVGNAKTLEVSYVPTEWEEGRLSGAGAGTGGAAIYHGSDVIESHAGVRKNL